MNKLNFLSILLLIALVVTSSCTKENLDEVTETVEEVVPTVTVTTNPLVSRAAANRSGNASEEGVELGCVKILFPFDLIDIEGVVYTIDSEESFETTLFSDSNNIIVDFVFPLNISIEGEELQEINSNEALGEAFSTCIPDGGWDDEIFPAYLINEETSCYTLEYPVSLRNPADETVITVNNEEEFITANSADLLIFEFPLNLSFRDSVVVINNVDELFTALVYCNDGVTVDSTGWDWENDFEYIGCYKITFPFEVETTDGATVTVADHETYCDLLLQGEIANYGFPLNLESEAGEAISVSSEEELNRLLDECFNDGGWVGFEEDVLILLSGHEFTDDSLNYEACYRIVFPISVDYVAADSTINTLDIQSDVELVEVLELRPVLNYPIEIIYVNDNTSVIINNLEELYAILENCD